VGGRILEVYADDALERGVITAWEPGERLEYRSSVDDTETTITFAPIDGGTRVTVCWREAQSNDLPVTP